LAQVDRLILQAGYGCQVDLVPGDTVPTLTSMIAKGQPDVAPEAWINGVREPLQKAVAAGRLHLAGTALKDGGIEGWWIPKFVADAHPEIRTIADALMRPDLFPAPENRQQGAVHNCPSGWQCQIVMANLFKAHGGAAKGFVLVDPGAAAALDGSIARAQQRNELNIAGGGTAIFGITKFSDRTQAEFDRENKGRLPSSARHCARARSSRTICSVRSARLRACAMALRQRERASERRDAAS
jgi:glycine betaine/proline transport system substrate-binding protein